MTTTTDGPALHWMVREYLARIGRTGGLKGGRSKSPAKQRASRASVRKANRAKAMKALITIVLAVMAPALVASAAEAGWELWVNRDARGLRFDQEFKTQEECDATARVYAGTTLQAACGYRESAWTAWVQSTEGWVVLGTGYRSASECQ